MTEQVRDCPDCGTQRALRQLHPEPAEPAECPDFRGGPCAEWYCGTCGSALLIGLPADSGRAQAGIAGRAAAAAGTLDRVA